MSRKTTSGWNKKRTFRNTDLISHLKSSDYINELDEILITGNLTTHDKLIRNNINFKHISKFLNESIDYSLLIGRLLVFTNNPFIFAEIEGHEIEQNIFKDSTIEQSMCKVQLCENEYNTNLAGILTEEYETNNKIFEHYNSHFRKYIFNHDHKFAEFINNGFCQVWIVKEEVNELDMNSELIQGQYDKYINGVLSEQVIIDCLEDGSLIITSQMSQSTLNNIQVQINNLQNILNTLTNNN